VSLGLIDIRKAFDRVNFWGILNLLHKKSVNPAIVDILQHWFHIGSARIKLGNALSDSVHLTAGVRQGGILSPLLFSAFFDVILTELAYSKLGCFLKGCPLNCFLYADDILLLSPSVTDLQLLINKLCSNLDEIDLQINFEKSCCIRIGNRARLNCGQLAVKNEKLSWAKEAKYLGITICGGLKFSVNWHPIKKQFFSSLNKILSALGSNPDISVVLSLFQSICVPILTYGLAAIPLSVAEIKSFATECRCP